MKLPLESVDIAIDRAALTVAPLPQIQRIGQTQGGPTSWRCLLSTPYSASTTGMATPSLPKDRFRQRVQTGREAGYEGLCYLDEDDVRRVFADRWIIEEMLLNRQDDIGRGRKHWRRVGTCGSADGRVEVLRCDASCLFR